jgi:MCM P-loop domain
MTLAQLSVIHTAGPKNAIAPIRMYLRHLQGFWEHHASAPLMGRNAIVASICPQLHGMFAVKLALLLMLIGGLTRVSDTGMHIRGDIHMLLVGDPGTGQCAVVAVCTWLQATFHLFGEIADM